MNHKSSQRYVSMDAIRTVMMLLGIVLHTGLSYNVTDHGASWPIKDKNSTHIWTDVLVLIIHTFRMPMFYVVAGFFAAKVYQYKGWKGLLVNRFKRIIIPFLVFTLIMSPTVYFCFTYADIAFKHAANPGSQWLKTINVLDVLPKSTVHLWFLYYLVMITGATIIIHCFFFNFSLIKSRLKSFALFCVQYIEIGLAICIIITIINLKVLGIAMSDTSMSFIPDYKTLFYFLPFFLAGWLLYGLRMFLSNFKKGHKFILILAFIFTLIKGAYLEKTGLHPSTNDNFLIALSSISIWCFIFGFLGFFSGLKEKYIQFWEYLSRASYWVYLIHLPIVVYVATMVSPLTDVLIIKFITVLFVTIALSFCSYELFVKEKRMGRFLEGSW